MDMTIAYGAGMFTAIILALVLVILAARSRLVASGNISIEINGERTIEVPAGGKLLQTLADADLFLASACGGGGTCAQCKCVVEEGGGAMLPTEESFFTRREASRRVKKDSSVGNIAPPPSSTTHLHWAQVPPPPQALARNRSASARVCRSLPPAGTSIVRSPLISILMLPLATSRLRAARITSTNAKIIAVNMPAP